jgi:hypothetical protein
VLVLILLGEIIEREEESKVLIEELRDKVLRRIRGAEADQRAVRIRLTCAWGEISETEACPYCSCVVVGKLVAGDCNALQ